ncbi:hypothetical protein EW093_02370 [Thiospirochaeta perfilievii]|uniref:YcgN family cysteine cluster protein n=1 Tax=Thiospirochaeta perfilievii TaxID=252967 RepID=A0A5C1Q8B4_9SPIO|nr:hypothetical protein [Thiospirochaeta perfilievii]QEN03588.1 hypothetical protein EW093_02370 [Thiospirochaeta perfilievii]
MLKKIDKWWESLCCGCGLCCYEKEFSDEDIIFINMEKPCKFLDCNSNCCTVYNKRFNINPDCKKVNLYEALFNPYLPSSCGYVKSVRFWKRRKNG